jgi:hypothetical protein
MSTTTLERKAFSPVPTAAPAKAVKLAPEGLVTAIVAVTGVTDAVNDLIVPGAFKATLAKRRPKVVDDHQWGNRRGRTLHAEEWLPGDKRLPKFTKDGKPWPAEAGALVATMQYNLDTPEGLIAWKWVKFYAETNEAEFSIGYTVPDTMARKRHDGVRIILGIEVFEFSHVLFGAHPMTMALEVKGMHGGSAGTVTVPTLEPTQKVPEDDEGATPPLPDSPWDDDDTLPQKRARMECKTAASVVREAKDGNQGNAESLRHWFVSGGDGAIPWGSPGDFDACVAIASKHMSPEDAKGYCNLRHHEALGIYPATHAALEGKTSEEAMTETKTLETKEFSRMKGSYEERHEAIEKAVRDLFARDDDDVWAYPVATYPAEVVVNVCGKDVEDCSYLIPYSIAEGTVDVELGQPEKVTLSLVAETEGGAEDTEVEDATVVDAATVFLPALEAFAARNGIEKKQAQAAYSLLMEGKSMPASDEPAYDAEARADGAEPHGPVYHKDALPDGEWGMYQKATPVKATPMVGRYSVKTQEGMVNAEDGWLALDNGGHPYPIADKEFDEAYVPHMDDKAAPQEPEPDATDPAEGTEADPNEPDSADPAADLPTEPVSAGDDENAEPTPDDEASEGERITVAPEDLPRVDDPTPDATKSAEEPAEPTAAEETPADEASEPMPDGDEDTSTKTAPKGEFEGKNELVTLNPDEHFSMRDDLESGLDSQLEDRDKNN